MSGSLTFVQTGDLHLGSPFAFAADKAPLLMRTQLEVFVSIVLLCQSLEVDALLIAGDLFDQPVADPALVRTVSELLGSLGQTKVLIAPGNHDPVALDSPYKKDSWPDNVTIFDDELSWVEWPDKRVRIYGCGFTSTAATQPLPIVPANRLDPDYVNLYLVHGDLNGPPGSPYNPLNSAHLSAAGYDYVALGHLHTFSGFQKEVTTTYAYAGCPFGRGFDETGVKGVIIGTVNSQRIAESGTWQTQPSPMLPPLLPRPIQPILQLTFQPMGSRMFFDQRVDLTGCQDQRQAGELILAALQQTVGESYRDHLYKITLEGETETDFIPSVPVISQFLSGQVFWFRLIDDTRRSLDLESLAREHSLRGAFVRQGLSAISQEAGDHPDQARSLARLALELGLTAMRGDEICHDTDPA